MVVALALFIPGWTALVEQAPDERITALAVGMSAIVISIGALWPAMLAIALAEGFRWRSVLFYAAVGGVLGLASMLGPDLHVAPAQSEFSTHLREIMTGAGIVGGFVYWALAGRNAGLWHGRGSPPAATR